MLNGTHFHLEFNIDIASIFNALAELCVTRARYLKIPVNTAQSADFQSYDSRPALRTDDSSQRVSSSTTLFVQALVIRYYSDKKGTIPMENELQDHWKYRKNGSCEYPLPCGYHKRAIKRWNLWNIAIL